jgi:hypothetical protein
MSEEDSANKAVAMGVEVLCRAGSQLIRRNDTEDTNGMRCSIFSKTHASSSSSAIFGCDCSRIIGGFGSGGGSILLKLHDRGGGGKREGRMVEHEVFLDVCDRLGMITNSEEALREVWRQITGTGKAKSHNVMHMEHRHGKDNRLAMALSAWLEEEFLDLAG